MAPLALLGPALLAVIVYVTGAARCDGGNTVSHRDGQISAGRERVCIGCRVVTRCWIGHTAGAATVAVLLTVPVALAEIVQLAV